MNILFVSISSLPHISEHSISLDLIHTFQKNGHKVFVICASERREGTETTLSEESGCTVLRVKIGNNKKANLIEKGLTTLTLPSKYIAAAKKYYSNIKFDLVLYPTPPVTHVKTIEYIKKRDNATAYLLLKDIFPQNAVDIGIMSKTGAKSIIYKHFRRVEKRLYQISDYIGCMSQANVEYLLSNNPEVQRNKVEICPNCIEVFDKSLPETKRALVRKKHGIPEDKIVFVYGGNLGLPQGVPFIINCLKEESNNKEAFFLIVGDGTEYGKLNNFITDSCADNIMLLSKLPKDDYDELVAACDVGMIFLDYRFTIPNFPSRLLSYMQARIPVLACTDRNTDIGTTITEGGFGWWCQSNDTAGFHNAVREAINDIKLEKIDKNKEFQFLIDNYDVNDAYYKIVSHMNFDNR